MTQLTPMMQQYMEVKNQYKDCILFYRLGDFYEMFFDDALTVSKELELTLTGKSCGLEERAPMCGVPYHAADGYLSKLIEKGYRVAICEQMEDPKSVKGLVKREVIRIVTPGTNLNPQSLDETKNNYLLGICYTPSCIGLSAVDITTGDYYVTEMDSERRLTDEINKYMPSEIICNSAFLSCGADIDGLKERLCASVRALEDRQFMRDVCENALKEHFGVSSLDGLGLRDYTAGVIAAGAVMRYLYDTQKSTLPHLTHITPYVTTRFMVLDSAARRNLELTQTLREKNKRGSLLWVLDKTKTAMGARLLRSCVEQPLLEKEEINRRLDAVEELKENAITREEIREYLNSVYDLERLMGRISYKTANPRDLTAFASSLSMLPSVKYLLEGFQSERLTKIGEELDPLEDIRTLITDAIAEEPPVSVREGGIIREGFHAEVDRLRAAKTDGKTWLAQLEAKERETTGIKNLRIRFNRVFGYYLEVTNSFKQLVPDTWIRKQTLTNAERYTTQELKELEEAILGAEDKLFSLEYDLFCSIRDRIAGEVRRIQQTAKAVARLDVCASLAAVAERNRYVRPQINEEGVIHITGGRHPVVERMIPNDMFVANDTILDNETNRISIITGPNMAGKSTYMRQSALIVLMAQIGSFVPAESADIGIVDRIFTRVGASDDLASGQSTFMVEMTEVANILRNATRNSLLILDEIGRGTSTFDGLSIAWAVVEHISDVNRLGAKTLFATHYHELTELEGKLPAVNNYCIAVREQGDDIVFLRRIVRGGADKSYGIQVARLAGVPESVLSRAKEIVEKLVESDITGKARQIAKEQAEDSAAERGSKTAAKGRNRKRAKEDSGQMSMFSADDYTDVILKIRNTDLSRMRPIDALNLLDELQTAVRERM